MIQRIQTLWLLLAGLINAGVFYFDLYKGEVMLNGVATPTALRVGPNLPLLLIAIVMTVLPLIAIGMFKNRKRQRSMTIMSIVIDVSFIAAVIMQVGRFHDANPGIINDTYWVGTVLPFISMVFLILALQGIRKDEKLIKSLDRLR